jgi:hypothetical protein
MASVLRNKAMSRAAISKGSVGGVKKNRLYVCRTTSLHAVLTHINGAVVP